MQYKFKSLAELFRHFNNEKVCYDFLEQQIWGGTPACPHCGSVHVYTRKNRSKKLAEIGINEYKCAEKGCSKNFTVKVGTIFESSKLDLQIWFAAIWLCTTTSKGVSSANLAKQLGITQKTAWFVLSRIREMFKETNPELLDGVIEADEAYVGGDLKNKHESKKGTVTSKYGRKTSRPRDHKTTVIGVLQRGGKVRAFVAPDATAATIAPIMVANVDKHAILVTDAHKSYAEVGKSYKHHIMVKTQPNSYITEGLKHTNNIEGFWSILKRGIIGVYHQTSPKHLQRYCDEYSFRYNNRELSLVEKFGKAVSDTRNARITYKELIEKK